MGEHIPHQEGHADTRANEDLLHVALTEAEEEAVWEALSTLHCRGSRDVFEHACKLCTSPEARERRVGADILGQLGTPNYTFPEETLAVLLGMLEQEREPEVLNSIAVALGHRGDPRATEPLVRLKKHPDEGVRFGVVFGLLKCHKEELAILTLIELSTDTDIDVRDWATFGLGELVEADTPVIREALVARLVDESGNVRGEAMVGLAHRRDRRMIEPLLTDYAVGDRGKKTCQRLWEAIPSPYRTGHCFTDFWVTYAAVIPREQHPTVGKETGETAHVERWNNTLRQRLARFVPMTLSFSKSVVMHEACLLLFLHRYNLDRAILLK